MVLHTIERAMQAQSVSRVIVATDDERIYDAVHAAGYEARMTSERHTTGTDRLAEVAETLDDFEIIVNVQADEPLIAPETIDRAVAALIANADAEMATTSEAIDDAADVLSPDVVKVVVDEGGWALYFSRSPIPFPRDLVRRYGTLALALEREPETLAFFRKHTGLYVYRRGFLLEYTRWQPSALEQLESLEQLRALARGARIQVVESHAPSVGVDTEVDLARVRRLIEGNV
jgi:3-deoxy-manno-octulosonate cytidylyltransferase (CMP-KDO synthetase)